VWHVPFSKDCNLVKFYEVNMYFIQKNSKFPKNLEVFIESLMINYSKFHKHLPHRPENHETTLVRLYSAREVASQWY